VQYDSLDDLGPAMEDTQDAALRHADADRVQRAIAGLPDKQRQALLLAYWGGHTHAEIAGLTNVPIGTVKSRIFKAFQRLRRQLHSTDEGTPGGER
jgi:RNA polymerase sigma-70 factor (ECF subfamily)